MLSVLTLLFSAFEIRRSYFKFVFFMDKGRLIPRLSMPFFSEEVCLKLLGGVFIPKGNEGNDIVSSKLV